MELGVPLELQQGSQGSSGVVKGNSGFLLSCNSGLRAPLEILQGEFSVLLGAWQESWDSSHVGVVFSILLDLWWGLLLSCIWVTHL